MEPDVIAISIAYRKARLLEFGLTLMQARANPLFEKLLLRIAENEVKNTSQAKPAANTLDRFGDKSE
ncbi:MAG: hypothetical protein ACAH07_05910 [Methylophilaceae bacterium]|nr:hypothetical protein [Methyloradius sp.]